MAGTRGIALAFAVHSGVGADAANEEDDENMFYDSTTSESTSGLHDGDVVWEDMDSSTMFTVRSTQMSNVPTETPERQLTQHRLTKTRRSQHRPTKMRQHRHNRVPKHLPLKAPSTNRRKQPVCIVEREIEISLSEVEGDKEECRSDAGEAPWISLGPPSGHRLCEYNLSEATAVPEVANAVADTLGAASELSCVDAVCKTLGIITEASTTILGLPESARCPSTSLVCSPATFTAAPYRRLEYNRWPGVHEGGPYAGTRLDWKVQPDGALKVSLDPITY